MRRRYEVHAVNGILGDTYLGSYLTRWGALRAMRRWSRTMRGFTSPGHFIARDTDTGQVIGRA